VEQASGHKLNWVVLEENVLRQRVTTDIATKGGQFDVITIGSYEAPIWGKQNWLVTLDDLGDDYDYADVIPSVKNGLSANGKLYAVPFYAESSFTFYRKDLFEAAGLPDAGSADLRPRSPSTPRSSPTSRRSSTASASAASPAGARTWPSSGRW
jgi:ABC-type glycerol-3-phosphate transport system substrate-binding protein